MLKEVERTWAESGSALLARENVLTFLSGNNIVVCRISKV